MESAPRLILDIRADALKVLPLEPARGYYEFWITISIQRYTDASLTEKEGEPFESVNGIAGPPYPEEVLVNEWMRNYADKLIQYNSKARAKRVSIIRISRTKKAKFSKARYRRA